MKSFVRSVREFNWKLWFVLVCTALLPALYQTLRVYFLGNMPGDWGVNIASQLSWVNLIYEIIEESFILPLYYLLGKSAGSREELENKTRTGLLISGGSYAVLSVMIIVFARQLCVIMASDPMTLDATVSYIRLESVASAIGIISKFLTVLFVTIAKTGYMYVLLAVRCVLSALLDTFLISKLPFSLDVGVNGIAFSNILVSLVLVIVSLFFLAREGIILFSRRKLDSKWLIEYGKIGLCSGLESLVRNVAFMVMISRIVNVLEQQGTYWVANNFIWTWLLLPATALYDLIKKETAESAENIRAKTKGYIAVSILFSLLWFALIPLWKPFIRDVLNSGDYETIYHLVLIQSPFYIIYIFNCICDGTIYGRGKTVYMLWESLFTNLIYYVIMFFLWRKGLWVPSLDGVALMFGWGMAFDLIPTVGFYIHLLKRENVIISMKNLMEK